MILAWHKVYYLRNIIAVQENDVCSDKDPGLDKTHAHASAIAFAVTGTTIELRSNQEAKCNAAI